METRKCVYCGEAIPADKRADSKFCSNSCKASHWEQHKHNRKTAEAKPIPEKPQPKTIEGPLDGLRGMIENKPKTDVSDVSLTSETSKIGQVAQEIKKETRLYKELLARKEKLEAKRRYGQQILAKIEKYLQVFMQEKERLQKVRSTNSLRATNIDAQALQDRLWYDPDWNADENFDRQKKLQEVIDEQIRLKSKLVNLLAGIEKEYAQNELFLSRVPRYEMVKLELPSPMLQMGSSATTKDQAEEQPKQIEPNQEEGQASEQHLTAIQSTGKLISSHQLREMNYQSLNFQGKWNDFFGRPAVVFHLAVHGKPGEGKSTFCIQFADYLAKNFGHVVYISGEEGFSKTLRDKVVNNKIDNPYLFFADISSFEKITGEIPNDQFHFIFIDSLDTLKIDAARLRELRQYYPQSGFITISQSTKDGKMRGSQEIIHDTDIAVSVEDGVATTTKNRYNPKGTEFDVFSAMEKPTNGKLGEIRNVI